MSLEKYYHNWMNFLMFGIGMTEMTAVIITGSLLLALISMLNAFSRRDQRRKEVKDTIKILKDENVIPTKQAEVKSINKEATKQNEDNRIKMLKARLAEIEKEKANLASK